MDESVTMRNPRSRHGWPTPRTRKPSRCLRPSPEISAADLVERLRANAEALAQQAGDTGPVRSRCHATRASTAPAAGPRRRGSRGARARRVVRHRRRDGPGRSRARPPLATARPPGDGVQHRCTPSSCTSARASGSCVGGSALITWSDLGSVMSGPAVAEADVDKPRRNTPILRPSARGRRIGAHGHRGGLSTPSSGRSGLRSRRVTLAGGHDAGRRASRAR